MDFTVNTYKNLLKSLQMQGFSFYVFKDFLRYADSNTSQAAFTFVNSQGSGNNSSLHVSKAVCLRHDVDLLPGNSLHFARIQHQMGIKGTYYFRAVPESWDESIITEIASLGHEIGYHYENLTVCNGNIEKAWDDFRFHLEALRKLAPVSTICMHGSPQSRFDSKDLWNTYDYRTLGIVAEPYFDLDFNSIFYLTDTGRRWDGWKVSVRDKVPQQEEWVRQGLVFRSTSDIVRAANEGRLPERIMMTFHPQRWSNKPLPWLKELVMQGVKNQVKGVLISRRYKASSRI